MDDRYLELLAAIARQAVKDLETGYNSHKHMPAADWLQVAGLLDQSQAVAKRGHTSKRRYRPSHNEEGDSTHG